MSKVSKRKIDATNFKVSPNKPSYAIYTHTYTGCPATKICSKFVTVTLLLNVYHHSMKSILQMAPSMTSTSQTTSSFTTQSILYTLLSIVFFILLLLVLTLVLRRKRIKALRRRAEASVTLPRMHPDQGSVL